MLPRSPACPGAVQRHLPILLESLWVSDDLLHHEWQRFVCGSRTSRRYGSFVPGPLESRRRMGKRRMAHLSEAFPPPLHPISSLWGRFWEVDGSQWQWQPPRDRNSQTQVTAPSLLFWLQEGVKPPKETDDERILGVAVSRSASGSIHKDILAFRIRIKESDANQLAVICDQFNQHFKHNLALSKISEVPIIDALRGISKDLRNAFPRRAAAHCLSFYKATWEGLVASNMLRTNQWGSVINKLITLLSQLPMTPEVQATALGIIAIVSRTQMEETKLAIHTLVEKIVDSWLSNYPTDSGAYRPMNLEQVLVSDPSGSTEPNMGMQTVANAVLTTEALDITLDSFPTELAEILRCLPPRIVSHIVIRRSCQIRRYFKNNPALAMDIRYSWISLVSQIPNAQNVFLKTWKIIEDSGPPLQPKIMSAVVLYHWISQGSLAHADLVKQDFRDLVSRGKNDFGSLLALVKKHEGYVWLKQKQLFKMLLEVKQYNTLYSTILRMRKLQMTISMESCRRVIEATIPHDPILAVRMYRLCTFISVGRSSLRLERCPSFILSMINCSRIGPAKIWKILRIPMYASRPPRSRARPRRSCARPLFSLCRPGIALKPEMVDLLTKMAVAFAHCKTRSPRVILRNITQCFYHLHRYRTSVRPELTRAIAHASINLNIEFDKKVPEERAAWAVRMIQGVEGHEIAETVGMIVDSWNRLEHKRGEGRHVLGTGPID